MDAASGAMSALGRAGIDGQDISLRGAAASDAAEDGDPRDPDVRIFFRVFRSTLAYTIGGAIIGAIVSPGVAFLVLGLSEWELNAANFFIAVFLSILGFSAVGALTGYIIPLQGGQAFELAQRAGTPGQVYLGVHTHDESVAAKAEEVLARQEPIALYRVDGQGKRVRAA
jgi:hypothetical protein